MVHGTKTSLKITVFWDMILCGSGRWFQHLDEPVTSIFRFEECGKNDADVGKCRTGTRALGEPVEVGTTEQSILALQRVILQGQSE
jgi:hypothetical protein